MRALAGKAIEYCRSLAEFTEEPGCTTRTFLSPPMHDVHRVLGGWMQSLGMTTWIDAVGNLRSTWLQPCRPRLLIGSHLDTVPNAGAFDGILGVVLGIALIEALGDRKLPFTIEIIGFSEEEGVRFGIPFIGSRALVGGLDLTPEMTDAIRDYGLDPEALPEARLDPDTFAYLEFHIEQGPVLESLGQSLGIVDAIVGQSRLMFTFKGQANHAGTTPMSMRRDALTAAAEWITCVETTARNTTGALATVGKIDVTPNAGNVIPGTARVSLDVRHRCDQVRRSVVTKLQTAAERICAQRHLRLDHKELLDQPAVPMDPELISALSRAAGPVPHLTSGAGHDAMILAARVPSAMLFLRSPGGISHHPDESVLVEDVEAALHAGLAFLDALAAHHA